LTGSGLVDFSSAISDEDTAYENLTIKLTSLPAKGVISVPSSTADRVLTTGSSNQNAGTATTYQANAITYTSNPEECASAYTDSFNYQVVDDTNGESSVVTANLNVNAIYCPPLSRSFNEVIKTSNTTGIIDFSGHIEYQVGSSSVLTLQVTRLPVNGVITISGSNATIDTSYAVNVITYTSNASECTSI